MCFFWLVFFFSFFRLPVGVDNSPLSRRSLHATDRLPAASPFACHPPLRAPSGYSLRASKHRSAKHGHLSRSTSMRKTWRANQNECLENDSKGIFAPTKMANDDTGPSRSYRTNKLLATSLGLAGESEEKVTRSGFPMFPPLTATPPKGEAFVIKTSPRRCLPPAHNKPNVTHPGCKT